MTPPHSRGAYLGFLNSLWVYHATWTETMNSNFAFSYYVGQMSATGMMVATGRYTTEWSWRLPLYIQVRLNAMELRSAHLNISLNRLYPPHWTWFSSSCAPNRETVPSVPLPFSDRIPLVLDGFTVLESQSKHAKFWPGSIAAMGTSIHLSLLLRWKRLKRRLRLMEVIVCLMLSLSV